MRIKRGTTVKRRHKKLLESVKGYRMSKHRLVKVAKEAQLHAGQYAFAGRKDKKSGHRKLWILRISQHLKNFGISYSHFMAKLNKLKISLNRKILADMVKNDSDAFKAIIDRVNTI